MRILLCLLFLVSFHFELSANACERLMLPSKGVVILVHGLNNTPELMNPLAKSLEARGFSTVVVRLSGHNPNDDFGAATRDDWVRDVISTYKRIVQCNPEIQIYGVGYSLGGLSLIAAAVKDPAVRYQSLMLLAPAIKLRPLQSLLRVFSPLSWIPISLPSFVPERVRAHRFTPLSIFREITLLIDSVDKIPDANSLRFTPTDIVIDDGDELISPNRIRSWININKLSTWRLLPFVPEFGTRHPYHHLISDPKELTANSWLQLVDLIVARFDHGTLKETESVGR